jgi:hypothetical protein
MRNAPVCSSLGGRSWWAHHNLTRMNIQLTILKNQVEEMLEVLQESRFSGHQRAE